MSKLAVLSHNRQPIADTKEVQELDTELSNLISDFNKIKLTNNSTVDPVTNTDTDRGATDASLIADRNQELSHCKIANPQQPFNPDYQPDLGGDKHIVPEQETLGHRHPIGHLCDRVNTVNWPTASSPVSVSQESYIQSNQSCHNQSMAENRIRVTDFLPDRYDGTNVTIDAYHHVIGYKDYICGQKGVANVNDTVLTAKDLDMFKYSLIGEARVWYESNAPFDSLRQLESVFLREFCPELRSEIAAAKAFADLSYNPKQKISSFVNKLMKLNQALNYGDNVLKHRFMSAMPLHIRRLAKLLEPKDFQQSVNAVKTILEDLPDEVNDDNNTLAVVDFVDKLSGLSLDLHTLQQQIDSLDERLNEAPTNFY